MKLINVHSQSKHAASTRCKSCCAHLRNQFCSCVAIRRDDVRTQFASNMQCNYCLLRKISFRTIAYTCAEVAPLMHACMHRIAARGLQILHKNVITFLRFLQSRYKHCCMIDATRCLNLAKKAKSQFPEKNYFNTRFDAEALYTHRNLSSALRANRLRIENERFVHHVCCIGDFIVKRK